MRKILIIIICLFFIFLWFSCNQPQESKNPIPTLTSISPTTKVSHMPTFILTATGTDFIHGAKIIFNGIAKQTLRVNSTQLTCQIEPEDTVLTNVLQDQIVNVTARNPSPGGGISNSLEFTICSNPDFTDPQNISNTPIWSGKPKIGIYDEGHVSVVWSEMCNNCYNDFLWVYFSQSDDYGITWNQGIKISGDLLDVEDPKIAVDQSGNINVMWWEESWHPDKNILGNFRRSDDNGLNWGDIINISTISRGPLYSSICVDSSGNIYAAWVENLIDNGHYVSRIYFGFSTNGGITWSQSINIPNANNTWDVYEPAISVNGSGNIFVIWKEVSGWYDQAIYFSESTDSGATWSTPKNISNNPQDSRVHYINMAFDNSSNIYAVWNFEYLNKYSVQFCKSTDNGITWDQPVNINILNKKYAHPAIAVDCLNNINLIWNDETSENTEIYFIRSMDNGESWTLPINISNTQNSSCYPDIAIDSSCNIYIVWEDSSPGTGDIYFVSNVKEQPES